MKLVRTGLSELLGLVAVVAVLIAVHSARLDQALVVVWATLIVGSCIRAVSPKLS
jgi:hypothetical protein